MHRACYTKCMSRSKGTLEQRRQAHVNSNLATAGIGLPAEPVVRPNGSIQWIAYSRRTGGTIIEVRDGRIVLAERYKDAGYTFLKDMYKEEGYGPEAIQAYYEYMDANYAGKRLPPYPEANLPGEVIKRRQNKSTVVGQAYEFKSIKPKSDDS